MLSKQNLTIAVNSATDTKRDEKLTDSEAFLLQQNVRFFKTGALVKRNGFTELDTSALTFTPKQVVSDNRQLFIVGRPGAGEIAISQDGIRTIGSGPFYLATNGAALRTVDSFGGEGSLGSTWTDYYDGRYASSFVVQNGSAGELVPYGVRTAIQSGDSYVMADSTIGTGSTTLSTIYFGARACWIENNDGVFLVRAAARDESGTETIEVSIHDENGGLVTTATLTPSSASSFNQAPAVFPSADRTYAVIAFRNAANSLTVSTWDNGGQIATANITTTAPLSVVGDGKDNGTSFIIGAKKSSDLFPVFFSVSYALALSWEQPATAINTGLSIFNTFAPTIWTDSGVNYFCFESISASPNFDNQLTVGAVANGSITVTGNGFGTDYNCAPAGTGMYYNGKNYLPVFVGATNFSSLVLIEFGDSSSRVPVGGGFYDQLTVQRFGQLYGSCVVSPGVMALSVPEQLRLTPSATSAASITDGVDSRATLTTIDLTGDDNQYGSIINVGDALISVDGFSSTIDGSAKRPICFMGSPPVAVTSSSSGGAIPSGTFEFQVCYERVDDQGNIIYSPVSDVESVTTVGPTASIEIKVRPDPTARGSFITIFERNTTSAGLFRLRYRYAVNTPSPSVTITLTDDEDFSDNNVRAIYTSGGVLESTPYPPTTQACVHQNRIIMIAADERDKVYYTQKLVSGEVPVFNNNLFIEQASTIPTVRDDLTAVESLADKLVIFRQRSTYYVAGDGADALGLNSSWTEPELISRDIGCQQPRSVISTPVGIFFKSDKGIYLVTTAMAIEYRGAAVEAYNSEEIVQSYLVANRNLVKFVTSERILCYDYLLDRWSVDTVDEVTSACVWQDQEVVLRNGVVAIENDIYQDDFGTPASIQMKMVTGWIKLTGIQDYGRIWRILLLGKYYSSHTLTVKVYYDYDDTTVETYTKTPDPLQGIYQFNIHLKRQKCEAIKIEVFDTGTGQSMDLTGMTLEVGVKRGTMKVPATRKF